MRRLLVIVADLILLVVWSGCADVFVPVRTEAKRTIVFTRTEYSNPQDIAQVMLIGDDGDHVMKVGDGVIVNKPWNGRMIWSRLTAPGVATEIVISNYQGEMLEKIIPDGIGQSDLGGYNAALSPNGLRASFLVNGTRYFLCDGLGKGLPMDSIKARTKEETFFPARPNTVSAYHITYHHLAYVYATTGSQTGPLSSFIAYHVPNSPGATIGPQAIPSWNDRSATLDWSPDGVTYTYSYDSALCISHQYVVFPYDKPFALGTSLVYSPDGNRLAYSGLDGDIHIKTLDGIDSNVTQTTGVFEAYPQWSPDGSRILCTSYEGVINQGEGTLEVIDVATRSKIMLYKPAYKGYWLP